MGADMGRAGEVLVFFIDAGGGHRAAARALLAAAEETAFPSASGREPAGVLAPLDVLKRLTGRSIEDSYNLLRAGSTASWRPCCACCTGHRAAAVGPGGDLARSCASAAPRAVVSVIPNFNASSAMPCARPIPACPSWSCSPTSPTSRRTSGSCRASTRVIVGSARASRQARELGLPPRAHPSHVGDGPAPAFPSPARRGGPGARAGTTWASSRGLRRAAAVRRQGRPEIEPPRGRAAPRRAGLARGRDLRRQPARSSSGSAGARPGRGAGSTPSASPRRGRGLAASDLLVTKPGPGSLAEAFHMRVPVVVAANASTIPQERYNTRFVEERGLGIVVRHWSEIPPAAAGLAARSGAAARESAATWRRCPRTTPSSRPSR